MRAEAISDIQATLRSARPKPPALRPLLLGAVLSAVITVGVSSYLHCQLTPLSSAQMSALRGMVSQASAAQSLPESQIWQRLFDRFKVSAAVELSAGDFPDSLRFLATMLEKPTP